MMRLGAHNSIAGGLHNAVAECVQIGGDALQMFCKNQRQWVAKPITDAEAALFRDAVAAAKVGPNMVHDSYLINLGNADPAKADASTKAFLDEYERSETLGIAYLNFHPGSHNNDDKRLRDDRATRDACLDRIAANLAKVLDATKGFRCRLVLENAAGQGSNVGSSWEELGRILDAVGQKKRMGVTIDTQHAWACGYDWVGRYDEVWDAFETAVGREHQVAFHLNDSKTPLGGRVDRHDTMGTGMLGLEVFRTLVNDRKNDGKVGYLETPEGPESWKRELATLRSLRGEAAPAKPKAAAPPKPPAKTTAKQARL
jgi:deoxyribonuclease-4